MRDPLDQKYHVYFNNQTLTYDFYASDLRIEGMPVNIGQLAVPGKDGALFTGSRLEPKHIRVTLTNRATSMADRRENMSWLMGVLDVDEPKKLSLGIDGSTTLYYLAIPTTAGDIGIFRRHMSVEVDFLALDPVMYGAQVTKTIPSGGSLTFTVGGNYPTRPSVSATAAKNGSNGYWRLRKNSGEQDFILNVPSAVPFVADCAARTLAVDGDVTMLNPSADWLVLKPGSNTIAMTGTGAATITYRERWLR